MATHPHLRPRRPGPQDQTTPYATPTSYDDIARRTVPLPDSSHRPTEDEVVEAHEAVNREPTELEALIAAAVRAAFADDHHLDGSDLGVDVDGTVAILTGSVVTEEDRRRAVEIARDVPGVSDVIDDLRVRL